MLSVSAACERWTQHDRICTQVLEVDVIDAEQLPIDAFWQRYVVRMAWGMVLQEWHVCNTSHQLPQK